MSFKATYCTFSEIVRHDPVAIFAHLGPVIDDLLNSKNLHAVHFVSDGLATQYRNIELSVLHLARQMGVNEIT